ncbi:MAG: DUF4625 domain-containing protein [Flavobacteriales bacterium]|nr:DUF4625 domain-containing protein [Flavobacteriales bacterium]
MSSSIHIPALFFSALVLFACKKEEPNEKPVVDATKPLESHVVDLGYVFSVEGIASDKEALSSVHFEISSPSASYNYTFSDSIEAEGVNYDYIHWITVPEDASVGDAILEIFSKDETGEESDRVQRKLQFRDKLDPEFTINPLLLNDGDLIELKLYKNENGVYDSVKVHNQTQDELLLTGSDMGGFRSVIFNRTCNQGGEVSQYELYDIETETSDILTLNFTIALDPDWMDYCYLGPPFLRLTFKEYRVDSDYGNDNGHHSIEFDVAY